MKKKKPTTTSAGGAASEALISSSSAAAIPLLGPDLKALIHGHSLFFDRLVELIPARFYLPTADDDKPWYQGLSKAAKASAKIQSRENLKKARRARLDPSTPTSTFDLLKKSVSDDANSNPSSEESEEEEEDDEEEEEDGMEVEVEMEMDKSRPPVTSDDNRSVTYEELRERLHRRIADLRAGRNTRPESQNKPKKPKKQKPKKNKGKKSKEGEDEESASTKKRKREEDDDEKIKTTANSMDLSFGKVKIDGVDDKKKKRRKLSKQKELERARKLEEAKKDPDKGEEIIKKHSWKAAVSRASGAKVHDDPKLLKESIKKEKKRQQKHAEKWKERMEGVGKVRAEKQKTRTENIRERVHQKKMRRIEKREKKLIRPGFEGRKEGYINE